MGFFDKGDSGQVLLNDSLETELFTCPDRYVLTVSVLLTDVSNAVDHTFFIAVTRSGEPLELKHRLVASTLPQGEVRGVSGLSLNAGETVHVYVAGGSNEQIAASVFIDAIQPHNA